MTLQMGLFRGDGERPMFVPLHHCKGCTASCCALVSLCVKHRCALLCCRCTSPLCSGMTGKQISFARNDQSSCISRSEIKKGQSSLCFSSVFLLMTAVNPLCPHLRWIWLFRCSFTGLNYLYISSSPVLEVWHI